MLCNQSQPRGTNTHMQKIRRLNMLGLIARWGHNVLLTSLGLLTIALIVGAT
jgi:hypothetical protein